MLSVFVEDGKKLLFKLFSGRPNVFLVKKDRILEAFKNSAAFAGSAPPKPEAPEFKKEISAERTAKNKMTEINPLLPRNLLPHLIEQHGVEEMSLRQVKTFTHNITRALTEDPHPRVLKTGDFCLWSKKWLDMPDEKACENVNPCVSFAYKNAVHLRRLYKKKEDAVDFLKRLEAQKKALIIQLKEADKSLKRAEEYEKFGHLLMAHAHEVMPPGADEMAVKDFYENDRQIIIPLNKGSDIAKNAEYYYEKAKDARRSYKKARERLPGEQKKLAEVQQLRREVENIERLPDLNSWLKDNSDKLGQFGFGSSGDQQTSSPYRKFKIGKYEVWIGKNAKTNDELTTRAHKEDIWLHARGVGGSHVVIRMGNQKDYPPKEVILQAAGLAAFFSQARGMKTAPVMYTKRKYVRKPKGASPGTVLAEREEVEMVPPINPQKLKNR